MKVCWITGAAGLIGSHVARTAPAEWTPLPLTRAQLDLSNFDDVRARFRESPPHAVIHCAALSKVGDCENNPPLAWHVNRDLVALLSGLCASIPLLLLSTDLVFDGRKGGYAETDPPNPLTVYAKTKVAAENIVLENSRHTVIRTSLNGGSSPQGDRSFTEQLIQAWRAGRVPSLFVDEFRSPIMAEVTAKAVWELLSENATGLYHVAGSERLSRVAIGELLAARVPGLRPRIERTSLTTFPGPPRSPDTSLDTSKARDLLSFPLPRFSDWLAAYWSTEA